MTKPMIFVNNRPQPITAGPVTAGDIATLAGVPLDNAVVELDGPDGLVELAVDQSIHVADGQRFLVTRQFIMGGAV
jgi:hypothetical protein